LMLSTFLWLALETAGDVENCRKGVKHANTRLDVKVATDP
jgi:hypothetical protein